MLDALYWFLIFICFGLSFVAAGMFLFFVIYANVLVLNVFYRVFTGKNLKIYERFSSCFEDREGFCFNLLFKNSL